MHKTLQPEGWAKPSGYANGIVARGRTIYVAGQVGWSPAGKFESDNIVGQVRQALKNIVDILAVDGAKPEHITQMMWFFGDKRDYLDNLRKIGEAYREVIGRNYPAMTALQVAGFVEEGAKVEIQAIAVVPD